MQKNKFILLFIFSLYFSFCYGIGNVEKIDSLEKILPSTNEFEKINVLVELSSRYYSVDIKKSRKYAEEGLKLTKKQNKLLEQSKFKRVIGNSFFAENKYDKAFELYDSALKTSEKLGDKNEIASNLLSIGILYGRWEKFNKSIEHYKIAIEIFKELNSKRELSFAYNNIGQVYEQKKDYNSSIKYYEKSTVIKLALGDTLGYARTIANIAINYGETGAYKKSEELFLKSLKITNKYNDIKGSSMTASALAGVYKKQNLLSKSLKYFLLSDSLNKSKDYYLQSRNYKNIANIHYDLGNYKISNLYLKKYVTLHDSLVEVKNSKNVLELQTKYETEKKDKEIEQLNTEKELNHLKLKNSKLSIFVLSGSILLIILLAILIYIAYNRKKRSYEKEKEINQLKTRFVNTISHEFRTPLTGILSSTEIFETINKGVEKNDKFFMRIYDAVNIMTSMLDKVGVIGKEQSGKLSLKSENVVLDIFISKIIDEVYFILPMEKIILLNMNEKNVQMK